MQDKLFELYKKCLIRYQGNLLPGFDIMDSTFELLSAQIAEGRCRSLILHPGTNALLINSIILLALQCLIQNESTPEKIVSNLNEGDAVFYGKSSFGKFLGMQDGCAIIQESQSLTTLIPPSRFHLIKPYYGDSKNLDKRGKRDSSTQRREFLERLLLIEGANISAHTDKSIIVVCNKNTADDIMKNSEVCLTNMHIFLSEIFSGAYYTENDVYYYAGNASKLEPNIKFTAHVSIAREMIIDNENVIGLIVSDGSFESEMSEICNLIDRKSLSYMIVLDQLGNFDYREFMEQRKDVELYAWTVDALLSHSLPDVLGDKGSLYDELNMLINNTIEKEVEIEILPSPISTTEYYDVKKSLVFISRSEFESDLVDQFVMIGFSLLKLFTLSIFPISAYEKSFPKESNQSQKVSGKIEILKELTLSLPREHQINLFMITQALESLFDCLYYENPKHKYIWDNYVMSQSAALEIIVPKGYYKDVFASLFSERHRLFLRNMLFTTPNKFRFERVKEHLLVVGAITGKNFNPYLSNTYRKTLILAYDYELPTIQSIRKSASDQVHYYNLNNKLQCELEDDEFEITDKQTIELENIDITLDEFVRHSQSQNIISQTKYYMGDMQSRVMVSRIATFDSSEIAFFTKNYEPYVLDAVAKSVTESTVDKLEAGSTLIFTKMNNSARDIIDELLQKVVNSAEKDNEIVQSYKKSVYWKEALEAFMIKNSFSYSDISRQIAEFGITKHEVTIRSWLNPESHIVGPTDIDSYYGIALLTEDPDMEKNPDSYYEACRFIRSYRKKILKYLGMGIINALSGQMDFIDDTLSDIIGDPSDYAHIVQIENIVDVNNISVSSYLVNRPQKQI